MTPSRRDLLRGAAAGAALALPATVAGQGPAPAPEAIGRKRIPSSGELLPMVGLGTSRTFDADPAADQPALLEVVRRFLARGGALIDSSPMYGQAEAMTGALLARLGRQDVFYATKVWTDQGAEAGQAQMEESRIKMGAARLDLIQIHNLVGLEDHLPTLRWGKAEGKVRYSGVTEMQDFERVEKLIVEVDLDFIQVPYSLGERTVEARVLPAALEHGVAVLVMRPFQRGALFQAVRGRELPPWAAEIGIRSWAQFFLKFLLGHPAVTCPIPATADPAHLEDNMDAGVGPLPDAAMRARMVALLEG